MMMKQLTALFFLAQILSPVLVHADMSFYAVAVGQGDSSIIQCPNKQDILILDMGATHPQYVVPAYITNLLKEKFNASSSGVRIHVVVSHSHTDHYGYLSRAIDDQLLPNVQEIILGGKYDGYGNSFRSWLESNVKNVYTINNEKMCFGNDNCSLTNSLTRAKATVWRKLDDGNSVSDPWQFCSSSSVKFTVLGANIGNTENGKSVILKITYNSWSMLMSGDFEMILPQEELIDKWSSSLKSNYYKVAHHGAWTDKKPNIPKLLDAIQPQKVYISQGYPSLSLFHHPNKVTIDNLLALDSIVKIDASTNAPFVYWDSDKSKSIVMESGMDRAIYETCRVYYPNNQTQFCQDIWIKTDGQTDVTTYVAVPLKYMA